MMPKSKGAEASRSTIYTTLRQKLSQRLDQEQYRQTAEPERGKHCHHAQAKRDQHAQDPQDEHDGFR